MVASRAFGHCHSLHLLRRSLTSSRPLSARHVAPTPTQQRLPPSRLLSTSDRLLAKPSRFESALASLEDYTIYNGGSRRTQVLGMLRVTTIVVFGASVAFAPSFYYSSDHSNWWVPVFVLGGAVPMFAMAIASAPYVCSIKLMLPPSQKKINVEALRKWAERVPADTALRVQTMRWIPWPVHRTVWFDELRRLPPSFTRLANVERIPQGLEGNVKRTEKGLVGGLIMRMMGGLLWVDQDKIVDKHGIWEKMWEQIPYKGEQRKKTSAGGIAGPSAVFANRPAANRSATKEREENKKAPLPRPPPQLLRKEKAGRQRSKK